MIFASYNPALAAYARSAGIKCGLRDGKPMDGKQETCIGMNGCCYCGPCCGPFNGPCCF